MSRPKNVVSGVLCAAIALLIAYNVQPTQAIVYNVSHTFPANMGNTGNITINGTITTNATGSIGTANLVSWSLTFSNPGGTQTNTVLTQANSQWSISGGASLNATATTLDFSVPVDAGFIFPEVALVDLLPGPDISWRYLGENYGGGATLTTTVILNSDGSGGSPDAIHTSVIDPHTTPFMGDLTGGAGAVAPALTTTPADGGTVDFGNVRVGTSGGPLSVTAENTGDAGTTLTGSFGTASGDFSGGGGMFSLGQGATDSDDFSFTPSSRGNQTQGLTVSSNGGNSGLTLDGTGVGPVFGSDPSPSGLIDFGTIPVDTVVMRTLDLRNDSTDVVPTVDIELVQLSLQSVQPIQVEFSVQGTGMFVLNPGDLAMLMLQFDTTGLAPGTTFNGVLEIHTDQNAAFGDVNSGDVFTFDLIGRTAPRGGSTDPIVPEPATGALALLGLAGVLLRRRGNRAVR